MLKYYDVSTFEEILPMDFTYLYLATTPARAHNVLLRIFCLWPTAFDKTQNLAHMRKKVAHACSIDTLN